MNRPYWVVIPMRTTAPARRPHVPPVRAARSSAPGQARYAAQELVILATWPAVNWVMQES
ncbi:hypothetical protein GCM10010193_50120 [Kitasatospora atroaurantiaca]